MVHHGDLSSPGCLLPSCSLLIQDRFEHAFSSKWKRCWDSKFPDMEAVLLLRLQNTRAASLPVSAPILMEKASTLAFQIGYTGFKRNKGGLSPLWQNNVASEPIHGKSSRTLAQPQACWAAKCIPRWHLQPWQGCTLLQDVAQAARSHQRGKAFAGAKQQKNRITILFEANTTGDEKVAAPHHWQDSRSKVLLRCTAAEGSDLLGQQSRVDDGNVVWRIGWGPRSQVCEEQEESCVYQMDNLAAAPSVFLPPNMTSAFWPNDQGATEITGKSLLCRVHWHLRMAKCTESTLLALCISSTMPGRRSVKHQSWAIPYMWVSCVPLPYESQLMICEMIWCVSHCVRTSAWSTGNRKYPW